MVETKVFRFLRTSGRFVRFVMGVDEHFEPIGDFWRGGSFVLFDLYSSFTFTISFSFFFVSSSFGSSGTLSILK